jgi:hypothetical protein
VRIWLQSKGKATKDEVELKVERLANCVRYAGWFNPQDGLLSVADSEVHAK